MLAKSRALILHPRQEDRGFVGGIDASPLCGHHIDRILVLVLVDVVSGLEPPCEFGRDIALARNRRGTVEQANLVVVVQVGP
ncbi:hypothetical protein ES703_98979 [subsurface metagenome]